MHESKIARIANLRKPSGWARNKRTGKRVIQSLIEWTFQFVPAFLRSEIFIQSVKHFKVVIASKLWPMTPSGLRLLANSGSSSGFQLSESAIVGQGTPVVALEVVAPFKSDEELGFVVDYQPRHN
jgi:hypothetical protein